MYLISLYFDDETNKKIQRLIHMVAEKTGNRFMIEGKVPPHITISAFETKNEEEMLEAVKRKFAAFTQGELTWCSVGAFFPYVLYVMPVLNEYLHEMSEEIYTCISAIGGVEVSKFYKPFQWFPHSTIGKKLSKEEMRSAFQVLQESFGVFGGNVTHIGLAKPNPHRDLLRMELRRES